MEKAVRIAFRAELGHCISDRFDGGNTFKFGVFVEVMGWCWEWDVWDFKLIVPTEESIWFGIGCAVMNPVAIPNAEFVESGCREKGTKFSTSFFYYSYEQDTYIA
jgi:hypothetical protein